MTGRASRNLAFYSLAATLFFVMVDVLGIYLTYALALDAVRAIGVVGEGAATATVTASRTTARLRVTCRKVVVAQVN